MLLYLDASCFIRPFDDQAQLRIREETDAVLHILQRIAKGDDALVWSSALTLELSAHPEPEIRSQLVAWERYCRRVLTESESVRSRTSRGSLMPKVLSDEQLRQAALHLLEEELGPVQTLRFLAIVRREPFVYQAWREKELADLSVEELFRRMREVDAGAP